MENIKIKLPNGNTLICGEGESYKYGGFLQVLDPKGKEIGFWDSKEWEAQGEGELVIGAVFACAVGSK